MVLLPPLGKVWHSSKRNQDHVCQTRTRPCERSCWAGIFKETRENGNGLPNSSESPEIAGKERGKGRKRKGIQEPLPKAITSLLEPQPSRSGCAHETPRSALKWALGLHLFDACGPSKIAIRLGQPVSQSRRGTPGCLGNEKDGGEKTSQATSSGIRFELTPTSLRSEQLQVGPGRIGQRSGTQIPSRARPNRVPLKLEMLGTLRMLGTDKWTNSASNAPTATMVVRLMSHTN